MTDGAKLLVVEDDQMMLDFALRAVASLGYSTVSATDAASALRWLEQAPDIRGVIIDMRLGLGPNGAQLAREALVIRPDLAVLMTSGDPASLQSAKRDMPDNVGFLPKPYRRRDLAARLSRLV